MAKIDRASAGLDGEFGPSSILVVKQPHGEVLEREGVKLRRVLLVLVALQVLTLAGTAWAIYSAAEAAEYASRAAARFQLEKPR